MSLKHLVMAFLAASSVAALGGVAGCSPSAGSYCNKVCECTQCTETERTDCIDSVGNARSQAENGGCDAEFNAYFSCINAATACVDNRSSAAGCEAEADALSKCGGPVILGGNACDALLAVVQTKFEECGLDDPTMGGEGQECTDQLAKQAQCFIPCYQNMDCIILTDPGAPEAANLTQKFSDCVAACSQ